MSFLNKIIGKKDSGAKKPSEKERIKSILSGNIDEYSFIMEKYQDKLFHYIKNLSSDIPEDDIDGLLQEIFIKAYQNLNSYNDEYAFSTWIYKITRNYILNVIRKNKTDIKYELSSKEKEKINSEDQQNEGNKDGDFISTKIADEKQDIRENLNKKEQKEALYTILSKLDLKYKEVLVLKYLEEKSYAEISDILEIPEGTVATYITRAKKQFKKISKEEGNKILGIFD